MALRFFFPRIFVTASLLALTSCSYAVETNNQEVTFLTPGAQNAYCDVFIKKLRYQVLPPQTINIRKVKEDMIVKCIAPGNRKVEVNVPSKFSSRAVWGTPVGMAWDYASESMFYYPSVIAVDFSKVQAVPNEPPSYNAPDIQSPDSYKLEEITPSVPRLNADKDKPATPLVRREDAIVPLPVDEPAQGLLEADKEAAKTDKGSLMSIIDRLNDAPKTTLEIEGEEEPKEIAAPYPIRGNAASAPVQIVPK